VKTSKEVVAFLLAAEITGVVFTPSTLDGLLLVGAIRQ
jgi:hypothetical protein